MPEDPYQGGILRTETVPVFVCEKCNTRYFTAEEAEKCESHKLRPKVFDVGDEVANRMPDTFCFMEDKDTCSYYFVGKIVEVIGPLPDPAVVDRYTAAKDGSGLMSVESVIPIRTHAFMYRVEFQCPNCKRQIKSDFFDVELELVQ